MTCFWDGILQGLYQHKKITCIPQIHEFIQFLKRNNIPTVKILHNGMHLHHKEIDENYKLMIPNINPRAIGQGYDCSTCDPVLMLIAHLFDTNIIHNYRGNIITYSNPDTKHVMKFNSSSSHFAFG